MGLQCVRMEEVSSCGVSTVHFISSALSGGSASNSIGPIMSNLHVCMMPSQAVLAAQSLVNSVPNEMQTKVAKVKIITEWKTEG